jgi:hypothetical protein
MNKEQDQQDRPAGAELDRNVNAASTVYSYYHGGLDRSPHFKFSKTTRATTGTEIGSPTNKQRRPNHVPNGTDR